VVIDFFRPFRAQLQNVWPYQALRAARLRLATLFRLRCRLVVLSNCNLSHGYCKNFAQKNKKLRTCITENTQNPGEPALKTKSVRISR
jgi:hypothetical protein